MAEELRSPTREKKKASYLLRSDKLNADLINDTLLNASTHFQILFIKKRKKVIQITKPSVVFSFD